MTILCVDAPVSTPVVWFCFVFIIIIIFAACHCFNLFFCLENCNVYSVLHYLLDGIGTVLFVVRYSVTWKQCMRSMCRKVSRFVIHENRREREHGECCARFGIVNFFAAHENRVGLAPYRFSIYCCFLWSAARRTHVGRNRNLIENPIAKLLKSSVTRKRAMISKINDSEREFIETE